MKNPLLRMIERDEFDNASLIEYAIMFAKDKGDEFYYFVEDILLEEDAEGRD